jgi:hypothetical protein
MACDRSTVAGLRMTDVNRLGASRTHFDAGSKCGWYHGRFTLVPFGASYEEREFFCVFRTLNGVISGQEGLFNGISENAGHAGYFAWRS